MSKIKILIAGEGGQGVQAIAEILAQAAFLEGKSATHIPNFGVEQRGGVSLAFVVVDQQPVVYPKFEEADILAILSDRSVARVERYQGPKTKTILGPAVKKGLKTPLPTKVWNVVVLREINRAGGVVSQKSLVKAMEARFSRQFKKDPGLKKLDLQALKG